MNILKQILICTQSSWLANESDEDSCSTGKEVSSLLPLTGAALTGICSLQESSVWGNQTLLV